MKTIHRQIGAVVRGGLIFFLASTRFFAADVVQFLPDLTPGNSTGTGVIGGIPDITASGGTVDTAAQGDDTAAINAAISSASAGTVVTLGAGTFTISDQITLKTGVVLRGSGVDATILQGSGSFDHIVFGGVGDDWPYSPAGASLASNASRGATTITLTSASGYTVGNMLSLSQDDASLANGDNRFEFKYATGGATNLCRQMVMVTGITGDTLTVAPALYTNYTTTRNAVAHIISGGYKSSMGIENLTIDGDGTVANGINLWQAYGSWIRNVKITNVTSYPIYIMEALHCEIRHSQALGANGGSNGAGILAERSSAVLIEDNIISGFPGLEANFGWTGNAVFANYFKSSTVSGVVGASIDTNHGPHNAWNLYEYNIAPNLECDGFFGTTSDDVVVHNWFTSVSPGAGGPRSPILLKRGTSYYTVAGNVLGTPGQSVATYNLGYPNIGNDSGFSGTSQITLGDYPASYPSQLESSDSGYEFLYQEKDLDVEATSVFKDNYNTNDAAIPTAEALGSLTIQDCYLYPGGTPACFGSLPLKGIDSHVGVPSDVAVIPPGYRDLNGTEVPSGGSDVTAPTPNPSTISSAAATGTTTATVIANTATDASSPPVQYAVSTDNGSTWSAWQSSATFNITGLSAATTYQCKVKARDSATTPNATTPSSASSLTTASSTSSRANPKARALTGGF